MPKRPRYILTPFSFLYGSIIRLRNLLYDKKVFRSATFDFPLICIGNLSVGGTGKTPMVEYLVWLLHSKYKTATLSRGYKRKTKGFLIAGAQTTANDIGDEPMQIHKKFPDITVAVAEERVIGIPQLLYAKPQTQVIILDDAFQHREVAAGLNILLTEYHNLYSRDFMLPVGTLRDVKNSSQRADIIIVTKCKSNLTTDKKQMIADELGVKSDQKIFFTTIEYKSPYHLFTGQPFDLDAKTDVLLVSGIASPAAMIEELTPKASSVKSLQFRDHHRYSFTDLKRIRNEFEKIDSDKKIIVTTEKDAARLSAFAEDLQDLPVYVLPMAHKFMFDDENHFQKTVFDFIEPF